jgi:hypothetical protein
MPKRESTAASPMPDSSSSFGVPMVPALRTTSREARASCIVPSQRKRTPTQRLPSRISEVASAPSLMVRLGRFLAGARYCVAVLWRRPR